MGSTEARETSSNTVLGGLRVVDLTTALSGPYGTLILAGLGAEVIKIEPPGGHDNARGNPPFIGRNGLDFEKRSDDDLSVTVLNRHRNKKSVTVNLKSDEGLSILRRLVEWADVFCENYSSGVARRLGVDYESVREWNPSIVYCSVTGFGEGSPMEHFKTMDILVQAMSGLMEVTGFEDGPPTRVGIPLADLMAPVFGVVGVLSALWQKERTGVGQRIEVSMIDALTSLVAVEHFDVMHDAGVPYRSGNHLPRLAPFGVYKTLDGFVAVSGAVDPWASLLFDAMGHPEMSEDARFATRGARAANSNELNSRIEAWTSVLPSSTVVHELAEVRGVPAVPVRTPQEALDDEFLNERGSVVRLAHPSSEVPMPDIRGSGVPIQFSGPGRAPIGTAPLLGFHTETVLREVVGLSPSTIAAYREQGIV